MSNSVENICMTSLPVNESFIQKSIIAQLPESPQQQESETQMQTQIGLLRQELQYYKKQASFKSKTEPYSFRNIEKPGGGQQTGEAVLRQENQQQKLIIKKLSQELRSKKKSDYGVDLAAECQRLQYINKRLQNENSRIQSENEQLNKQLMLIKGKNNDEVKRKVSEQVDEIKRRNMQLEQKVSQLTDAAMQYTKEIDTLNLQIQKLKRENVIDRGARQSSDNLRVHNGNSRYSIINMNNSRALSQLELLDTERLNLKISEKNKEYEQLYLKYQSLEYQLHAVQQINNDLERQRKFLAERLSDIEIHTQGDEIVGELQNKLVLMSTELMRLGNLSRTKTQQSKELSLRVKELILKRQHLEKDIIERDKLILNYKEQLRLMEIRSNQRAVMESRVEKDTQMRQKNSKLMKQVERLGLLIKQKSEALKNSEIRNAILQQKNTRLEKQNEQLQKQNKEFMVKQQEKKKIHTKVLNLQAEVNYFKEANSALKGEMKRYQSKLYENRSDIDMLGRERQETRNFNQDLQDKILTLQEELRRTQLQLQEKNTELRQINHKAEQKVILKSNQIKKLQEKVLILQKQAQRGSRTRAEIPRYEQLVKEIQRLQGVQLTLKLQIGTYEEKIVMLAQQNERLNLIARNNQQQKSNFDRLKSDNQQKERKIRELNKQVESSNSREKRYKEQNQNLRERLRGTMVQQRESEGLEFKNRQLRDQIDALKTQLSVKEEQVRNLNDRYRKESSERYNLLLKNEELTSRLATNRAENYGAEPNKDYYQNEMKTLNNELRAKNDKLIKLEQELGESQQTYNAFSAEIQRLNLVLQKRTGEVINFKKEIDFLQHKVHTCEESLKQRNNMQIASEKSIAEAESKTKIQIFQGKIRNFEGELQLMKQRYDNLKRQYSALESKLGQTMNEKNLFQQRTSQLQYQLSEKSSNFRHVQDSFKLTILQIKKSNQRLEQAMGQIQNHYIQKIQKKQRQCQQIRAQRKTVESQFHELQRKFTNIQSQYGSEIKQKNLYINSLSSNHNQTKQEIAQVRRIKGEYQVKITLLSQEIQRVTELKDRQRIEIELLRQQIHTGQNRFTSSMRESTANTQTIDVLSAQIERLNTILVENAQKMRENTKKTAKLQSQCLQLSKDQELARSKSEQCQRILTDERENSKDRIRKLDELNKQLKYQLQEKTKDADRFLERIQTLQKRQQTETNEYMRTMAEEMKLLRQGNFKLQEKLVIITREYQQLVTQLQYYKRPKSNESDEKMRIIGNYQATIKHMHEENSLLDAQRHKLKIQNDRIIKISHEMQERSKISQQKVRVFEQKCKRLDQRCRVLQDRARSTDQTAKVVNIDRLQVEQKMFSALQQVSRLQAILKTKDVEIEKLQALLASKYSQTQQYYQNIRDKKGIFVIKQASEVDERSRSASGNGPQPLLRHPPNHNGDLQHRQQLLQNVNKKLSAERQCLRAKVSQYEYKMKKLKEEFDLINRLIHEYREENDKLKQANKALIAQGQRGNNFMASHSQFSSPQHSSIKGNSYIDHPQRHLSPPVPSRSNIIEPNRQQNIQIKNKLGQEIDRLTKVNNTLQNEIHDLRINSTDNVALRMRLDENLALVVILFAQIQSLRLRVRESQGRKQVASPVKN